MTHLPLILLATGVLLLMVTSIWMVVLAFQRHVGWGVAVLLVPFASVAFLVVAWEEAKRPFYWGLSALLLFGMAWALVPAEKRNFNLPDAQHASAGDLRTALLDKFSTGQPDAAASAAPEPLTPPPSAREEFKSQLPPPSVPEGQREMAKPGFFYITERVVVTTSTGVKAARPGEEVRLLQRLPGEKMRVVVGNAEFTVSNSQVTDDLTVARVAERRDYDLRRQGRP